MDKKKKYVLAALAAGLVLAGGIYAARGNIGVTKGKLEKDFCSMQYIDSSWEVEGSIGKNVAVYIANSRECGKHKFSVYAKRKGLSAGYFFRLGGSNGCIADNVAKIAIPETKEVAYISSREDICRVEIAGKEHTNTVVLDVDKPLALVFPEGAKDVTFVDIFGRKVDVVEIKG